MSRDHTDVSAVLHMCYTQYIWLPNTLFHEKQVKGEIYRLTLIILVILVFVSIEQTLFLYYTTFLLVYTKNHLVKDVEKSIQFGEYLWFYLGATCNEEICSLRLSSSVRLKKPIKMLFNYCWLAERNTYR
jgi:low temperature requirement protein LtrA